MDFFLCYDIFPTHYIYPHAPAAVPVTDSAAIPCVFVVAM